MKTFSAGGRGQSENPQNGNFTVGGVKVKLKTILLNETSKLVLLWKFSVLLKHISLVNMCGQERGICTWSLLNCFLRQFIYNFHRRGCF